jgi:short subunit dehydrogenase-like uncharacterized protein
MSNKNFLLYGANGFTGVLIAKLAAEYGLQPTLAGRNEKAIQALAKELKLPYQIIIVFGIYIYMIFVEHP